MQDKTPFRLQMQCYLKVVNNDSETSSLPDDRSMFKTEILGGTNGSSNAHAGISPKGTRCEHSNIKALALSEADLILQLTLLTVTILWWVIVKTMLAEETNAT